MSSNGNTTPGYPVYSFKSFFCRIGGTKLGSRKRCCPTCCPFSLVSSSQIQMDSFGVCRVEGRTAASWWRMPHAEFCSCSLEGSRQLLTNVEKRYQRISRPLRVVLVLLGSLLLAQCEALPFDRVPYPPLAPTEFPYTAYNPRRFGSQEPYFFTPPYFVPPRTHNDLEKPGPPYAQPFPYPYDYPAPDEKNKSTSETPTPAPPEPYLTKPYDYTKDFLKSLESIKELEDPAVRTAMLALKELEPTQPGSLFGDEEVKVVALWRRTDDKWGLGVNTIQVPQGHNPTVQQFLRLFLLNASTAASSKCSKSWFRIRLKVEARLHKDSDAVKSLKHEDMAAPLRYFKELRIVLEDTLVGTGGSFCFTRTLDKRLADFMPSMVFGDLQPTTVKLLILKPVSMLRHVTDEAAPYADGPVSYSFDSAYKTSFMHEIQIPNATNPTLHFLAKRYVHRVTQNLKVCSIANISLVPSFAAIAKDESGKVHVLPLTNLDTPLRALGWAAEEAEAETDRKLTVNLVLFLRNILKSEAANPCFEANFRQSVPQGISEKVRVLPLWVTTQCRGILLRKCRRKVIEVHFTDLKTNVRDALSALRANMHVNPRRPGHSSCFIGRARLKRRGTRLLVPGNPWREIQPRTLLMDIIDLKSGVLLAPATSVLTREATTAHTVCPSYVSLVQQKKPFVVYHITYAVPKQPESAFGPHSIKVFD